MSKNACTVKNNIITNVTVIPDEADPKDFGMFPVPEGKWIGDLYLSESERPVIWAELDAAYQEGVNTAYDS